MSYCNPRSKLGVVFRHEHLLEHRCEMESSKELEGVDLPSNEFTSSLILRPALKGYGSKPLIVYQRDGHCWFMGGCIPKHPECSVEQ